MMPHDPELDPPRSRSSRETGWPPPRPQDYQRLVANPFLAFAGLVVWFAAMSEALAIRNLPLVALAFVSIVLVARLLHYHCLDCGTTGNLRGWRSHACEAVRMRRHTGQVRRFRGPNPVMQTLLWLYFLAIMAILAVAWMLADPA